MSVEQHLNLRTINDTEIVQSLQEYVDETEHQGDPMPPAETLQWMYDFALYRKRTATI